MDRRIKEDLAVIFKYFSIFYMERWVEQKLTGSVHVTVNFFKGGLSDVKFNDVETKKIGEMRDAVKLS